MTHACFGGLLQQVRNLTAEELKIDKDYVDAMKDFRFPERHRVLKGGEKFQWFYEPKIQLKLMGGWNGRFGWFW